MKPTRVNRAMDAFARRQRKLIARLDENRRERQHPVVKAAEHCTRSEGCRCPRHMPSGFVC